MADSPLQSHEENVPMKKLITMMAIALSVTLAGVGSAHEITLTDRFEPQFSVWLPNDWTVTLKKERITAVTDDGLLWCGVWDLENTPSLKIAKAKLEARAEAMFDDVAYDEPVEVELEGMPGASVEGRGTLDGKKIVFFLLTFQHADDRVGVVAFIGDPAIRKLYRTTIIDIADSITGNAQFYADEAAAAEDADRP
jgi:hypothetical protein